MSMAPSTNGFLLLDGGLNLIAANDPALQILSFPGGEKIKQPKVFLADRPHHPPRPWDSKRTGFRQRVQVG